MKQVKIEAEENTSADSLLLSWQDPRCVDDADALKNLIGHLRADEPEHKQSHKSGFHLNNNVLQDS